MANKGFRLNCRKALDALDAIREKFPLGISDVAKISEESRAWVQMKIQHFRECIKEEGLSLSKYSWWNLMRLSRNKTAHQKEDFSDNEFLGLCDTLFPNIPKILSDLRKKIGLHRHQSKKKRKFESFAPSNAFGSEADRKQLIDAMEDMASPIEHTDIKIEFPQNNYAKLAEKTFSDVLDHDDIKDYIQSHEGVSENIQTDILEWMQQTKEALDREDPFLDESIFIEQQKKLSTIEVATDLTNGNSKIQYHYRRLPSVSESKRGSIAPSDLNFDFYKN